MALRPDNFPWLPRWATASTPSRSLSIRWLGTAGYELVCDGVTLLIDPYLTRLSLPRLLLARIRSDEHAIRARIRRADGIVVGHSHFDHLMDVPFIAKFSGARVWGSRSTANLLRASGIPESQIVVCSGGEEFEVGPFRVQLVPSEHSRFALGGRVPFPGEIPSSCEVPMWGREYRCGQVFGIAVSVGDRWLYHMGSANLIDDAIPRRDVDMVLLCLAARHATKRFIPRALQRLRPRWVVPTHYDNFFRGADRSLELLPLIAFDRFVNEVAAFDRDIDIATIPMNRAIELPVW